MKAVRVYRDFSALKSGHAALFARAAESSGVFCSLPWFRNLADTALTGDDLFVFALESAEADEIGLMLPMRHATAPAAGLLAPRTLSAAANFYTSLFSPLFDPMYMPYQRDVDSLVAFIAKQSPKWDMIDLRPMDASSPLFGPFCQALRRSGMAVQTYFCFGNWFLEVAGQSFDTYWQRRPAKLRNTVERKRRQLEASGKARIVILTEATEVDQAIAAFESVYRASWKNPEPHSGFIPGLIRMCAGQGWLRLGVIYVDDVPAAAQLWIVCNGVASIYKLAYDERYAKLSLGSILTAGLMQHVIDVDRVREVDYLTGDEMYKQDWMSCRRERTGIAAFNLTTPKGLLAAARHLGLARLKRFAGSRATPAEPV